MNILTVCPCCSSPMLHHLNHYREYWFCRHCWSEMPNFIEKKQIRLHHRTPVVNLSISSERLKESLSTV